MHRTLGPVLILLALAGCSPSGVGDPCIPEEIPEGGFDGTESYLETSSVQCRSRVCLVFKLDGDPRQVIDDETCPAGSSDCVNAVDLEEKVTCSCRCDTPEEIQANTPTCSCPGGFACQEIVASGGAGIAGSYCVSKAALCREGQTEFCE